MKPINWTHLPKNKKLRSGTDLFTTPRGKYIVSQALCLAIERLQTAPEDQRETSNIEDMEMLYETVFDQFKGQS